MPASPTTVRGSRRDAPLAGDPPAFARLRDASGVGAADGAGRRRPCGAGRCAGVAERHRNRHVVRGRAQHRIPPRPLRARRGSGTQAPGMGRPRLLPLFFAGRRRAASGRPGRNTRQPEAVRRLGRPRGAVRRLRSALGPCGANGRRANAAGSAAAGPSRAARPAGRCLGGTAARSARLLGPARWRGGAAGEHGLSPLRPAADPAGRAAGARRTARHDVDDFRGEDGGGLE